MNKKNCRPPALRIDYELKKSYCVCFVWKLDVATVNSKALQMWVFHDGALYKSMYHYLYLYLSLSSFTIHSLSHFRFKLIYFQIQNLPVSQIFPTTTAELSSQTLGPTSDLSCQSVFILVHFRPLNGQSRAWAQVKHCTSHRIDSVVYCNTDRDQA